MWLLGIFCGAVLIIISILASLVIGTILAVNTKSEKWEEGQRKLRE